jgi:hypothetical protein
MAGKRMGPAESKNQSQAVTAERFTRLFRMLQLLKDKPQPRQVLLRQLHLDVRGFYRDLELLRQAGITVALQDRRYALTEPLSEVLTRLPFPDPHLTYGDVQVLARGRTSAQRKLKALLNRLVP